MSKTVVKFLFSLVICFVSIGYVKADVIWPTLIISQGMLSIPSITIGLIIEILFVKEYTDFNWIKSFYVGILLNAVSGILGFFIIVLGGLPIAFIVDTIASLLPTQISNSLTELASYIFYIVVNVLLEGATLKSYFKKEFHETYKWLLDANIVSVSVAMASLAFTKHTIRF